MFRPLHFQFNCLTFYELINAFFLPHFQGFFIFGVDFDANSHRLSIIGESYPENTAEFYDSVFSWLEQYLDRDDTEAVTLNLDIPYFNSSSSKVLMDLFDLFDEAVDAGKRITVNWMYDEEDDSTLEAGEEFQEDLENLTFNFVTK